MGLSFLKIFKGIILKGESSDPSDNQEGSMWYNSTTDRFKGYAESAVREVLTANQTQTVTGKTLVAASNTITTSAGELNSVVEGLRTDVDAADAAIAAHIGDTSDAHDASAVSITAISGITATDVQGTLAEIVGDIDAHLADTSDAHDASAISVSAISGLTATDVQAAIAEHQTEIDSKASATDLTNHISDTSDAHDASAISVSAISGLTATDVQAAIAEHQTEIDSKAAASDLTDHISDTSDAHDASAISVSAISGVTATDVQAALAEHQADIDGKASTTLNNLGTTAINAALIPGADGTLDLGSLAGNKWNDLYMKNGAISIYSGSTLQGYLALSQTSGASGATLGVALYNASSSGALGTRHLGLSTTPTSSTTESGSIYVETGNASGSGNSGSITLQTGTSASGTRGSIVLSGSSINASTSKITNVVDPTSDQDAATKKYVDDEIAGIVSGSGFATAELDNLGTTAMNADLIFANGVSNPTLKTANSTGSDSLYLKTGDASAGSSGSITIEAGTATATRGSIYLSANNVQFQNNFTDNGAKLFWDNTNKILSVGDDALNPQVSVAGVALSPNIVSKVEGATTTPNFAAETASNTLYPRVDFYRARTDLSSESIVSSGDTLGQLSFYGFDDNTGYVSSAAIAAAVDGNPGANDMPGRLVFYTAPDGSTSVAERMRIHSTGRVSIGSTSASVSGLNVNAGLNIGFTESATENYVNFYRANSSGGTILANGYKFSGTAGFASSVGGSYAKAAIGINHATAGTISFYVDSAATASAGTDVTPTERMRIDTTNSIKLNSTGSGGAALTFQVSGANVGVIGANGNILGNTNSDMGIFAESGRTIVFYTNGSATARMQIGTGGAITFPSISTTASAANAFLDSGASNSLLRSTSSIQYKQDVRDLADSEQIYNLRPVTYRSKAEADDQSKRHLGLIAEEVHGVEPMLVHYADGQPDGVQYERLTVLLLAELKKLRQEFNEYKSTHP